MSNTTLYPDQDDGSDNRELERLLFSMELPFEPLTVLWRAFTGRTQTWTHDLVKYTLEYNQDAKAYALMVNNLVA